MVTIAEKELQDNGNSLVLNNGVKEFNLIERIDVKLNTMKS